jgi:hypothetical protein
VVVSAVTIGLFRAAYESASLEVMRAAGIRRRVVLVGEGESLPLRLAGRARGGLTYEFVGAVATSVQGTAARRTGRPRAVLDRCADEVISPRPTRRAVLGSSTRRDRDQVKLRPRRPAARPRGSTSRAGRALRATAPVYGLGLGVKRRSTSCGAFVLVVGLPIWPDRPRGEARLARADPVRRPARRRRRA